MKVLAPRLRPKSQRADRTGYLVTENAHPSSLRPGAAAVSLLVCTLVAFCCGLGYFLQNDFWQDEAYSLQHFVFVPWKTVFTDYHSTNNHIAFNAALKLVAGIFGIDSLQSAMQRPYLLRLVPVSFLLLAVLFLFRGSRKHYGWAFAFISVSVLCSSIVLVDFGAQVRGYSMSVFLSVVQYFTVLKLVRKRGRSSWDELVQLFGITALSLLCLPTNIYLTGSLLLLLIAGFFHPRASRLLFSAPVVRFNLAAAATVLSLAGAGCLLYYKFLLGRQPENPLITSFHVFSPANALQALAVFFHFTDTRFYFYGLLGCWAVWVIRKRTFAGSAFWFPACCFFLPFLFFFIHGAVIVQRTFVPLFPFFACMVAATFEAFSKRKAFRSGWLFFGLANVLCLGVSFGMLVSSSRQNNRVSVHRQDLRNHYYLVGYNPQEAVAVAAAQMKKTGGLLFVWDDFGETGVLFYLSAYRINYQRWVGQEDFRSCTYFLTNNKPASEKLLAGVNRTYRNLLPETEQYALYELHR